MKKDCQSSGPAAKGSVQYSVFSVQKPEARPGAKLAPRCGAVLKGPAPRALSPTLQHSNTPTPRYSLANTDGFWELTFDGCSAILRQDQALFYVAWLLGNPPG